jgi:hypothetical protein
MVTVWPRTAIERIVLRRRRFGEGRWIVLGAALNDHLMSGAPGCEMSTE